MGFKRLLIIYGLLGTFFTGAVVLRIDTVPPVIGVPMFAGFVAMLMTGTGFVITPFFRKDHYPEFFQGPFADLTVFEKKGVKFGVIAYEEHIEIGESAVITILVENAYDTRREFEIGFSVPSRIAGKITGKFNFKIPSAVELGPGEVGLLTVPYKLEQKVSPAKYELHLQPKVRAPDGKGRRMRRKYGVAAMSTFWRSIYQLLALPFMYPFFFVGFFLQPGDPYVPLKTLKTEAGPEELSEWLALNHEYTKFWSQEQSITSEGEFLERLQQILEKAVEKINLVES